MSKSQISDTSHDIDPRNSETMAMPISVNAPLRQISQDEFRDISYEIMRRVFAVHNELGPFFDESIYQSVIESEIGNARTEIRIDVTIRDFCKKYFIDLLVDDAAVFEFKDVSKLSDKHRAQLLNYLLLSQLPHGKLINVRSETVEHEFVNTSLKHADRSQFQVDVSRWNDRFERASFVRECFLDMLDHWGTSLSVSLYSDALTHFLGNGCDEIQTTEIQWNDRCIGHQPVSLVTPVAAFQVTGIGDSTQLARFENHIRRFLAATTLECFFWLNVSIRRIKLQTIANKEI